MRALPSSEPRYLERPFWNLVVATEFFSFFCYVWEMLGLAQEIRYVGETKNLAEELFIRVFAAAIPPLATTRI
jgi:hypothetical protein